MIEPNIVAVDSLQFLVLVDNCLDSLSSVPPNVTLEWPRLMSNGMRELSGEWQCCANHGLSVLVTAANRNARRLPTPGPPRRPNASRVQRKAAATSKANDCRFSSNDD